MSIFTAPRRSVKLHPLTPATRPARTFGEGIEVETTPVNRIAAFLPAPTVAPVPAVEWSEADWKRAAYFGLKTPVGMKRPAPVAVVVPAVEAPARPIRLARGERQVWDAIRQVWTYRRAILAPSFPTADEVWNTAMGLALAGVDAAPAAGWPADLQAAFEGGVAAGLDRLDVIADQEWAYEAAVRESHADMMDEAVFEDPEMFAMTDVHYGPVEMFA